MIQACESSFWVKITRNESLYRAKQNLWILVTGIGFGALFQPIMIGIQASMPLAMMATSTATMGFMRLLGGTIGISIADAIFKSELTRRLTKIQDFVSSTGSSATNDLRGLSNIQPDSLRDQVLHAYSRSISVIFVVCLPMSFVALLVCQSPLLLAQPHFEHGI